MRSETAPLWVGFVIGLGVVMLAVAIMALATGRVKLTRDSYVLRDEKPEAFWALVVGCIAISIVALVVAIPHFGPGG